MIGNVIEIQKNNVIVALTIDDDKKKTIINSLYFTMKLIISIIDIITSFNFKKRCESYYKSVLNDAKAVSAVNPKFYAKRFLGFIKSQIGHDDNARRMKNISKRNLRKVDK